MTAPRVRRPRLAPEQIGARSRDAAARAAIAVLDPTGARTVAMLDAAAAAAGDVVEGADALSLKALAWKYGCAAKDSDRERLLRRALLERARTADDGGDA